LQKLIERGDINATGDKRIHCPSQRNGPANLPQKLRAGRAG